MSALAAFSCMVALAGCHAAAVAFGPDLASAHSSADALLQAFELRFTSVLRTPKFAHARMRMARYALAPSKLENDTALWTGRIGSSGATRELLVDASMVGSQYTFIARHEVPVPGDLGDSRDAIRLAPLGDGEYLWSTEVVHHVGTVPPARLGDVVTALFKAAERNEADIRGDYRGTLPAAVKAWGRLFVLDSLQTVREGDGSTTVRMHVTLAADKLTATMPSLARYVNKYVARARYRMTLSDRSSSVWFDLLAEKGNRAVVRFRSRDGALQPLEGPARAMPDTLQIAVDARTKLGMFTVGVTGMRGDFVQLRGDNDRGWVMHFTGEPEWQLPLGTEHLLKSSLHRPFQGRGIVFRLALQRSGNGPTFLERSLDVMVQESAIMRILGNLGFTAMDDFAGAVETDVNRFLAEGFAALRSDLDLALRHR